MPLHIVSTPIGNLKDITFRAIETLKESDIILAEDTRRTSTLLNHYNIKLSNPKDSKGLENSKNFQSNKKLISYNDKNKEKKTESIIQDLKQNKHIALVSDSGTPGISDPGFYLIRECIKNKIKVIPIPGPTASITALTSSGFPTNEFTFYGFLPKKEKAKTEILKEIKNHKKTTIIYESPYRLIKTLKLMEEILPNRKICIARELTKKFEDFIIQTAKEAYNNLKDKQIKGEITIIINKE